MIPSLVAKRIADGSVPLGISGHCAAAAKLATLVRRLPRAAFQAFSRASAVAQMGCALLFIRALPTLIRLGICGLRWL